MLSSFTPGARDVVPIEASALTSLPSQVVWLDMLEPSPEEVDAVERRLGIAMPTREEMREIEASSRVYEEGEAHVLTTTVLYRADEPPPQTTQVSFILKGGLLLTLRFAAPQPFRTLKQRLERLERHTIQLGSAEEVLFWLLDAIIARHADVMERAQLDVDELSMRIFGAARPGKDAEKPDLIDALARIGRSGDTLSKVRECLHTIDRALLAISATELLPPDCRKEARQRARALSRDVQSLTDQIAFVSSKIELLLEATLGMISIEQTNIIKIFSVLAIVLLPPTLIASIYGMNFALMPELAWPWGYPLALLLMVLSAMVPYVYFKRKGWL
jgi:magnesium transporter